MGDLSDQATEVEEMFRDADKIQHKPLRDDQWAEAVECYQRAKIIYPLYDKTNEAIEKLRPQVEGLDL